MSPRGRLTAVGATAVLLEAALAGLVLVTAGPARIALYLMVCAVTTALVMALVWKLLDVPPDGPEGPGGGGGPDDDPPPPWWPEFERDFRRHAADRESRTPAG